MTDVYVVDEPNERAAFEDFVRKGAEPRDPNFLARAHSGAYVVPATKAAWAAWQARAISSGLEGLSVNWSGGGRDAARLFRDIQSMAAAGINECTGNPLLVHLEDFFARIHRASCSALTIKSTEPPGASS